MSNNTTVRSHKKNKRKDNKLKLNSDDTTSQSPPKKVKLEKIEAQEQISTPKVVISSVTSNATLGWDTEDLNTLINNLAKCLPKNDVAKFSTLVEKLDWEKVRFSNYSAQECKDKWFQVMSRLRRYRTLTDMVSDARVWLKAPWQTYNNAKKLKHPDLPKKPLTPFFRYFMEKREKTGKSNPGSSVTDLAKLLSTKFAALNERKKQKYKDSYDREYEEYKKKLEQFKVEHPEVEFGSMNKTQSAHGHSQEGPPRPRTPQQLFMEEKLKKVAPNSEGKKESIERIKGLWSQLSEGKRIKWIRKALQDEVRYEAEVLEYIKEHPSFEPNKLKSVLTKAEKELKDKFDGKPERPPNSGYSLFSKILLRELKNVPSKEKMVVIAKRWKELSEQERQGYNREAQKTMTKYVEKFEAYLNSLPETERAKVLSENKLKLPSEKKLKQQQNLPKLQIPVHSEPVVEEDPRAKEHAALMYYQMERYSALQTKYPNKGKGDIMKMTCQEWNEKLNDKRKSKYYKLADSFAPSLASTPKPTHSMALSPNKLNAKDKKSILNTNFLKREPKRPPKTGYALYTSEQLSSLTDFEPKKRMTEIARKWKHEMDKSEKENYDIRAKALAANYQKDLAQFITTLNPSEQEQYQSLQTERSKPKTKTKANKSSKTATDPVVDDSNVIETIDVSTSGNAGNSSDESNSESEDESDNDGDEEQEEDEPQATQTAHQSSDSEESESESEGSESGTSDSSYE